MEKELLPKFDMKDIKLGENMEIILDCTTAIRTGEGKYGPWYLWIGIVENLTVKEGRYPNETLKEGYSGKVIFFPTAKLNEQLEKATKGTNVDVKIRISKNATEGRTGTLIKSYSVEQLSEGRVKDSSSVPMTALESTFVADAKELIADGYELTEQLFIKASQEPQYHNISKQRATELYKFL